MNAKLCAAVVAGVVGLIGGSAYAETTPPPAGARIVDFTDVFAPVGFPDGKAVRHEYAALGVEFTASGLNGGAILDDATILLVSGFSPPSFLAFSGAGDFTGGGTASFPQTLEFRQPVRYVQFNAGSAFGNTIDIEAFDKDGNSLGTEQLVVTSNMQTISIEARHIAKLVISAGANGTVLDDLAFVLDTTVIDFDDFAAVTGFSMTTALRDRYAPEGVSFTVPGGTSDGGAVLDEDAHFTVTGYSPPNYFVFNSAATLQGGGKPQLPEQLVFSPPVKSVSIKVADSSGSTVTLDAFDSGGQPVDSDDVVAGIAMQTLHVEGRDIALVELDSNGTVLVTDDLEFEIEGTLVDFDDLVDAKDAFVDTTALRDRYKALGIQFRGVGKNGPAILDEQSMFEVENYSSPNFLAFNSSSMLGDGGVPQLPLTLFFNPPIKRLDLRVGDVFGHEFDIELFDAADVSQGTSDIVAGSTLKSFIITASGATRAEITSSGPSGVIDDVAFIPVDPCVHDVCRAGAALDDHCHICSTLVCASNSDCCHDEWTTECAKTILPQVCEYVCLPICGDANDDRRTTSTDALLALKTAVGSSSCPVERCDYNGDDDIKSSDALAILRAAVGTPTTPKCPNSITTP